MGIYGGGGGGHMPQAPYSYAPVSNMQWWANSNN